MSMKRRHVLAIIIILITAYILAWHVKPVSELNMLVVNKTVPEADYREHRAIFWIAEHRRFVDRDGKFLKADRDYLGFHPESGLEEILTADNLQDVKLLYLADTYGIYDYEEGLEVYEENLPFEHQDIELLYGGFSLAEVEAIKRFAQDKKAVIVGEHNIFGYPTYTDPEAAAILHDLFAVKYDGWLARYYSDLEETAFWMKELYSRIYGRAWDLEGAGMVFIREDVTGLGWYTDMVIIERSQFNAPWPVVRCIEHYMMQGAAKEVPYLYWVEILEIDLQQEGLEVPAYYELPLGEEAREALQARGLEDRFPAVVYYSPPGEAKRIYFAGDFADQLPALLPPNLTGSAAIQRFFSYIPGLPVEYRFYFQWYEPVLHNILNMAADGEKENE